MKKTFLVVAIAALVAVGLDSQVHGQSSQIDRMRQESQNRLNRMQEYSRARAGNPEINSNDDKLTELKEQLRRAKENQGYEDSSSSSGSSGFRVRRSRGLGKLIGLVVVGVFAVGGFILRMILGDND